MPAEADQPADPLFAAGGRMGEVMASWDWAATPVGRPENWPAPLRQMVRILLTSRFSMWMAWGPELTVFYNDAYQRDTLRAKHPWALGRPAREVWAEIWDDIGPRIRSVLETGEATWDESLLLFLERAGYVEETYHTFSYSPLQDEDGQVAGMLCVVTEDTERVLGERRLRILSELGDITAVTAPTIDEACTAALRVLERGRGTCRSRRSTCSTTTSASLGCAASTAWSTTGASCPRCSTAGPPPTRRCGRCWRPASRRS